MTCSRCGGSRTVQCQGCDGKKFPSCAGCRGSGVRPCPVCRGEVATENDCEDQGFTRIEDGCFSCLPTFDKKGRPVRPKLVQQKSPGNASLRGGGPLYWVCPKCGGYYGEVR